MMRRRHVLALLGGAAAMRAVAAGPAQGAADHPARVGFISGVDHAAATGTLAALRDGLAAYGYAEPRTLALDQFFADYAPERLPALLEEAERRRPDVIFTHGPAAPSIVLSQRTIPAVYVFSADPVSAGMAADLAHPLFNATGITFMVAEINGKRLELLREIMPDLGRVAVLANPSHPGEQLERAASEAKSRELGIETSFFPTPNRGELERALAALDRAPPDGLVLFSDGFIVENRSIILNFAAKRRIPVAAGWAVMAESGALFTYGPRLIESYRRVGYFIDRLLKGAKPAELPIEQPTVFELVINQRTATSLGLEIPPSLLAFADKVIE